MDPRPAYSRIDLLCCSVTLHLKGTWETQNHQAFCVSLVLVSFTLLYMYRAACPLLVKLSTINLSLTSEESLTDSSLPDTGYLRTKGQESVYETCACVIHTILLSYMCIRPYLIDFMFRGSGGSDFCSLQKKKKKWARSCACVRAPNCVVVTQLCSRKKINDIHGDFNDIHAFFFFFFYPPPGSQFSLGNP